jgi:hypothetical protein
MTRNWNNEHRDRLTPLEMAVKVLGARYPVIVAERIGPGCPNVPAAVAALRQKEPHFFEATTVAEAERSPMSLVVRPRSESMA